MMTLLRIGLARPGSQRLAARRKLVPESPAGNAPARLEGRYLTAPAFFRAANFGGLLFAEVFYNRNGGNRPIDQVNNYDDKAASVSYSGSWAFGTTGWSMSGSATVLNQVDGPSSSPGSNTVTIKTTVSHLHNQSISGPAGPAPQAVWPDLNSNTNGTRNWVLRDPAGVNLSGTIHISFSATFSAAVSESFPNTVDVAASLNLTSTFLNVSYIGSNIGGHTATITPAPGFLSSVITLPAPGSTATATMSADLTYALPNVSQLAITEAYADSLEDSSGAGIWHSGDGDTSGFSWSLQMTVSP